MYTHTHTNALTLTTTYQSLCCDMHRMLLSKFLTLILCCNMESIFYNMQTSSLVHPLPLPTSTTTAYTHITNNSNSNSNSNNIPTTTTAPNFCDCVCSELEVALRVAAEKYGRGCYIPSGALWGAEDIAKMAQRGTLGALTVTMTKHPSSLKLHEARHHV